MTGAEEEGAAEYKVEAGHSGVGPHGIMRVDPKTKEVLDHWDYQVLRNWAYSRKTFVLVRTFPTTTV